jgi:hypothetical protein
MGATALSRSSTIHAAIWIITLAPAVVVVAIPGLSRAMRNVLRFEPRPTPGTLHEVAHIASANGRVLGALLLAAVAVTMAGRLRPLLDATVLTMVAVNLALVGVALGAYRGTAIRWLPHLPFEWTALALAVTAYFRRRGGDAGFKPLVRDLPCAAALVVVAAAIETYLTPQS